MANDNYGRRRCVDDPHRYTHRFDDLYARFAVDPNYGYYDAAISRCNWPPAMPCYRASDTYFEGANRLRPAVHGDVFCYGMEWESPRPKYGNPRSIVPARGHQGTDLMFRKYAQQYGDNRGGYYGNSRQICANRIYDSDDDRRHVRRRSKKHRQTDDNRTARRFSRKYAGALHDNNGFYGSGSGGISGDERIIMVIVRHIPSEYEAPQSVVAEIAPEIPNTVQDEEILSPSPELINCCDLKGKEEEEFEHVEKTNNENDDDDDEIKANEEKTIASVETDEAKQQSCEMACNIDDGQLVVPVEENQHKIELDHNEEEDWEHLWKIYEQPSKAFAAKT